MHLFNVVAVVTCAAMSCPNRIADVFSTRAVDVEYRSALTPPAVGAIVSALVSFVLYARRQLPVPLADVAAWHVQHAALYDVRAAGGGDGASVGASLVGAGGGSGGVGDIGGCGGGACDDTPPARRRRASARVRNVARRVTAMLAFTDQVAPAVESACAVVPVQVCVRGGAEARRTLVRGAPASGAHVGAVHHERPGAVLV